MAVKEKAECATTMEWSAEEEIQLFKALGGLKPIGINKHFYMACICGRLSVALKREIYPEVVWAHLATMYNLEMLDSLEPLPFPQEQRDFVLPEAEFSELMAKKRQEVEAAEAEELSEKDTESGGGAGEPVTPVVKSRTTTPQPQSGSSKPAASRLPSQSSSSSSKSMSTAASKSTAPAASTATTSNAGISGPSTSSGSNHAGTSTSNSHASSTPAPSGSSTSASGATSTKSFAQRELEKKINAKLAAIETPKRSTKRTRGSMSVESNSPSTTPPPTQNKRRRM